MENQKFYVSSLGWAGFGEKHVKFESFCILDLQYTKEVGAQRDEKDKCYVQKEWPPISRKIFANYRTFENLETFLFEKGITE